MKKSFLTIILSLIGITTWAYDVKVNDIYYNVIDKAGIAEVTYGDSEYTGEVSVPSSITSNGKTYAVTAIGDRAFNNCWNLSSVTLPNSIETIKDWAFSYCSLNSIEIPNSVRTIRDGAFQGAILTSVSIPNSVTSLGYNAFLGCYQMESVSIPNSVKSIGNQAFAYCTKLKSISIPNSMTGIEWGTFRDCESLTSVEFPSTLQYIGDISFQGCTNLSSIDIPNSVVFIGFDAFKDCGLTSVSIPSSVTLIGNNAFWNCYKMTSVTLPNSLTNVGTEVFGLDAGIKEVNITCTDEKDFAEYISRADIKNIFFSGLDADNLIHNIIVNGKKQTEINIPSTVRTIGEYAFINCPSITSVIIPSYVRNIGNGAFEGCKNLETVTIPNSVTSIGSYAFYECHSLTSVTIPNSVTSIGESAFWGCSALIDVYCLAETMPSTVSNPFYNLNLTNVTLHVPEEAVSIYKSQEPWSEFGKVVAVTPESSSTFALLDGVPYTNTRRSTYDAVTFSKTFSATNVGKWNALYVPISIDVTEHADDFDIAEIYAFCSTVDTNGDGTVDANDERFLFVRPLTNGQTYPNTPYLIRPREAKTYIIKSADNILYEKREGKVEFSTTRDKFVVTGLNEEFTVVANDNNYYVSGSGKLSIRTSGSTTVKPNRWIMHREDKEYSDIPDYVDNGNHLENDENADSGVKAFTIIAIGEDISESDAIQAVKNVRGEFVKGVYNLDCRQVDNSYNLRAGVYIKNGKKVIIK